MNKNNRLAFIDLFAGAGGLSEGFIQAGFLPIAHVEKMREAADTLETRTAYHYLKENPDLISLYYDYERGNVTRKELLNAIPDSELKSVICEEMSDETLPSIFERIDSIIAEKKINKVDVIIGGPPCQAYSLVGRAQSSHMLIPMEEDPRNELYKMYTAFLEKYKPEMFVFENVSGIKTARKGQAFEDLKRELDRVGYDFDFEVQVATDFGVLQKRKRIILVGWRKGTKHKYPEFERKISEAYVSELLDDLAPVKRGEENNCYSKAYDDCSLYLRESGIRTKEDVVTHHIARPNCDRDVNIYGRAIDAYKKGEKLKYDELPDELKTHKNQSSFRDRFKVVEGDEHACHTVLAHLAKDGHYFIHPDKKQCRSITVREAARLQTFPDSYYFEGNRGSKFTQIGNAVPPIMAKGIAEAIKKQL